MTLEEAIRRIKQLEAENRVLWKALSAAKDAVYAERIRRANKAAGFPDNTLGVP